MKKHLLLMLFMLAIAGMTMAQDVYYSGYYNSNGQQYASVYKNGVKLHGFAYTGQACQSNSVVVKESTGDYYWVENTPTQGHVIKNGELTPYLSAGVNSKIYALTIGSNLFSAGYTTNSSSVKVATYWRNDGSPYYVGNGTYNSEALGAYVIPGGAIYTCGYQYTSASEYNGVVWQNSSTTPVVSVANVIFYNVTFYDGYVWAVGQNSSHQAVVYQGNTLKYTLSPSENGCPYDIKIDAGDVYVTGYRGSTHVCVWKNGEVLYDHVNGSAGYLRGLWVNTNDVYYAGCDSDGHGLVYKNGEVLYNTSDCENVFDVYVTQLECEDPDVRTLPFYEGFEAGDTDWECWTAIDVDDNNGGSHYHPYWGRWGTRGTSVLPYEGDYSAHHGWGVNAQEGWLISPQLFLQPGRDYTRLKFWSNELNTNFNDYRGVWVSTSGTSTSSFTEVYSISSPSSSWHQITVDLSAYQGQTVYIAFKYTGTDGVGWNIDDIEVTESWSPCGNDITEFPYEMHFDYNPFVSSCWYLLDNDHTGGMKCWQWDESSLDIEHPYGQNNGINQEGWLFTPKMALESGLNYTMTFNTFTGAPGDYDESSVWIAIDEDGVPDPAHYSKIWEETTPSASWRQITLDLSAYAGHGVRIAFKYAGVYAHRWAIDDLTVTAALPQYNINVEANNASWGSVEGGGTFEQGETVTITATPNTGYEFIKWTKDGSEVSNNASYTFTVTENATYVAVFGEPAVTYYDIYTSASPADAGTVTGDGTYAEGTEVTLVASANTGWHFVRWQDNNTDNPRTITVNGDATYTAYFQADIYALTVTASPVEGGTATGGGTYPYGSVVALNAIPKTGYEFLNWNDGVTTASRNVTVVGNASYVAHFIDTTTTVYNVTALANDPTLGEVTGGGSYPEGAEVTLTASAFGSAVFVRWSDDNTENPRVITVTGDVTYTAYFEVPTMYAITVVSQNPEMGSVSGGGNFPMGAEVTIQANPFGGYYFDGWTDNNYDNPRTITVTGDATYTAKFSAQQSQTFTLTTTCNPTQGYVDGSGNYLAGTTVTITAVPYDGYAFDHWNDGNTDNPRAVTVDNNMTLVAFFTATGVDENGESVLGLYPNPAKEMVRIEGIATNSEVEFYNALGMLVKTVNANAGQEINVGDLAAGLYLIRCGNQTIRFVKE